MLSPKAMYRLGRLEPMGSVAAIAASVPVIWGTATAVGAPGLK
jgi:hypothetical protein